MPRIAAVNPIMRISRDRERGATLVEAAIVTLPFMLVVFAILEFGLAFRTDLTISNASQRASRAASVGGRGPVADFQIVEAVKDGLDDGGMSAIERVIVYKAADPDVPVPAGCLAITNPVGSNGVPGLCNVYGPDAFAAPLLLADGTDNPEWQCAPAPGTRTGARPLVRCRSVWAHGTMSASTSRRPTNSSPACSRTLSRSTRTLSADSNRRPNDGHRQAIEGTRGRRPGVRHRHPASRTAGIRSDRDGIGMGRLANRSDVDQDGGTLARSVR